MSYWGEGVFDNDSASDYRLDLFRRIIMHFQHHIFEMNKNPVQCYQIFKDEVVLGILSTLHLLMLEADATPPEPNDVRYWRKELLNCLSNAIPDEELEEKSDYFARRRLAIEITFDSIDKLSDEFWSVVARESVHINTATWQPLLMTGKALDFVGDLLEELKIYIQADVDEIASDGDEWVRGERIVPYVYIMRLLCEKCDMKPPHDSVIGEWKKKFTIWWRKHWDYENEAGSFLKDRYEVITETFDDLIYLSKNWIPYHQRKSKAP